MFEPKAPNLLKLTMIACPDFSEGKVTAAYVNPLHISAIIRQRGSFIKESSPQESYPRVDCTAVILLNGHNIMVLESPEIVASLHERAIRETTDN